MSPGRFPFRSSTPSNPQVQGRSLGDPPPPSPPITLEYAVSIAVRRWVKRRVTSMWRNLKADVEFCRDAFKATFAEGWWRKMIAALSHLHRVMNWVLGSGLLALVVWLYATYVYPVAGKRWTAIVVLSLAIFGLLMTIRVTRRLYEKTAACALDSQAQLLGLKSKVEGLESELTVTTERLTDLEKRFEPYFSIDFEPDKEPYRQYFPRSGITQYRVGVRSPIPVSDVELVANKVEIDGVKHDNIHLRPRHDRNKQGTKRVALKPFKEEAWDIVSEHEFLFSPGNPGGVVLNSIGAFMPMVFDDGDHEFELMVTGGDSFPATQIVKLEIRESRIVSFDVQDGRLSDLAFA